MQPDEAHQSAAGKREHGAAPMRPSDAAEALRNGPIGALVISAVVVALLFIGWMAFYFLLFMPRGPIG
jgi:hypothetical protein